MQKNNKLFTNTTNRQPILPLPKYSSTQQLTIKHQCKSFKPIHPTKQLILLAKREELLERQIEQAKDEHQMMMDLFENMLKIQTGQVKQNKKMQRRCNIDILDKIPCNFVGCKRFYSSEATLQRHVKLKHKIVKDEPPSLYHDLHPQPNLTTEIENTESQAESHFNQSQDIEEDQQ